MIKDAIIIEQPYSGQYTERIYNIESPWNSSEWTWIKFDDDNEVWCGEFRGVARDVVISEKNNSVFILTTDYLYVLSCETGAIEAYETKPQYNSMTITPRGDILVSDDYSISIITQTLDVIKDVELPFELDMIRFCGWAGDKLTINCYKFLEWENEMKLIADWKWNEGTDSYEISWSVS